jgi:hypothetical protein
MPPPSMLADVRQPSTAALEEQCASLQQQLVWTSKLEQVRANSYTQPAWCLTSHSMACASHSTAWHAPTVARAISIRWIAATTHHRAGEAEAGAAAARQVSSSRSVHHPAACFTKATDCIGGFPIRCRGPPRGTLRRVGHAAGSSLPALHCTAGNWDARSSQHPAPPVDAWLDPATHVTWRHLLTIACLNLHPAWAPPEAVDAAEKGSRRCSADMLPWAA